MNSHETFRDDVLAALVGCAAHHFEEAAHYAHVNGLEAHTQLHNGAQAELCLTVKRPSDGVPCVYRIGALADRPLVVHEKTYGEEVQRLEAPLESIHQTLVETELAAVFIKAAALPLDYVAERHQPGFI